MSTNPEISPEVLEQIRARGFVPFVTPRGRKTRLWIRRGGDPKDRYAQIIPESSWMLRLCHPDDGSINQPPQRIVRLSPR